MLMCFVKNTVCVVLHNYTFKIESQIAHINEIDVARRKSLIFFVSFISLRTKTANNAFTIPHNSAIGYAFHIPIFMTAMIANIFPIAHIQPEKNIGYHILIISSFILFIGLLI